MKFFRRTDGCVCFDHKRNEKEFGGGESKPSDEKLRRYKSNWLQHVTRINNNKRIPKIILNYRPNRRRRVGRPFKRLLDEAET